MGEKQSKEKNPAEIIINVLSALLSVYSISYAFMGYDLLTGRSRHLLMALPMCFLSKGIVQKKKGQKFRTILYVILSLITAYAMIYIDMNSTPLSRTRLGMYITSDYIAGFILIVATLVATWLEYGLSLTCVVGVFILYMLFGQYLPSGISHPVLSYKRMIGTLSLYTEGIMGTALGAIVSTVGAVLVFAGFLEISGASKVFMDLTILLFGRFTGGAAKIAVVSSSLFGTISGSAAANVAGTGIITIPLMRKTGFEPHYAGAVEATASSGGQIMPPIMGAAAFLMAEMVGVQYGEIAMRAIFPALLYFTGIFITVHLEAKRLGLKGIPKDELPKFGPLFVRQGYLLIPLVALVAMVMMGYTMSRAAIIATALAILVSMPNKETRMNPTRFINALEAGGKNTLSVAVACGVAGIIAGVVTMTGLGQLLISAIVGVAGDRVIVALFLTMLTCIVLGMGVPTTANYIIMATTCAPILVNGMGINKIAANMFVFYFGIVADITPPVALAAYAGSAIAKSNPMKTALNASRLAIAAFIVPYIFAFNPAMLFIDTGVLGVVTIIVTSLIGLFGVAAGLEGYMFANLNVIERLLSIVGGLCLIIPGTVTDLVGIVLVGISAVLQMMKKKKAAVA